MTEYPKYFLYGARPVMLLPCLDGNLESFCYDWASGEFIKDMTYLTRTATAARPCEISEDDFYSVVEQLRNELNENI